MTQDEIIEMARQAGFDEHHAKFDTRMEAFAKLVAAKERADEREACAKVCDKEVEEWKYDADVVDVAIAIRARGEAT